MEPVSHGVLHVFQVEVAWVEDGRLKVGGGRWWWVVGGWWWWVVGGGWWVDVIFFIVIHGVLVFGG